ncbi:MULTISPECIES: GNAT family N-acetyltransferase [unclassified Serratia (in: enterobacteria)]|uniref:GNAT family N-acetyltransferase n=1 Tax=unclassified Serratia (in: enterobacteria) TaxID=2647522 RepID=UPI0030765EAF
MNIEVIRADYGNPQHAESIVELLDHYARDPMRGAEPLSDYARTHLVAELAKRPFALTLLALADGQAAGLANCFEGFSTFSCLPLLNIHDLAVSSAFRGLGISQHLLAAIEAEARQRGCCKITLEVLEGNAVAQASYRKFGFAGYQLQEATGRALFWQKTLS